MLQSANIPDVVTLDQWAGMNRAMDRDAINDQECWWLENFFPLGPGQLRSAWGPSAPIYTAPGGVTILRVFTACIDGVNPLAFMFRSDGIVDQVNLNTNAVTSLGSVWQPVAPNYWADLKLWSPNQFGNTPGQSGGVVLGSPAGLFAWDGLNLSAPGQPAPPWLTGGGSFPMPSGLPGIYSLEVYKDRLWVMGQTVISFSAPANGADFSASGGGGSFPYNGDQLTSSLTDLQASSGFIYVFADSSTDSITDLQLNAAGSPIGAINTTQFLVANVDPQIGQRFFRPVGVWEILFAAWTGSGIYLLTGGQFAWASQKMQPIFNSLNAAPFQGTIAPVHVFGQKWMLFNGTFTDTDGVARSMMVTWSGPQLNQWFMTSQRYALTHLTSFENYGVISAYGTDGTSFYKLFAQPDPALRKRIQTKAYVGQSGLANLTQKDWKRVYVKFQDNSGSSPGATITGTQRTAGGGLPNGVKDIAFMVSPGMSDTVPAPTEGKGISASLDLSSLSPDFTVVRIQQTFDERTLYGA